MDIETIRFQVQGKVQGVFFRQSARQQAINLGLKGYVRNLPDGTVEALAQGSPAQMNHFRTWLCIGPPLARVAHVLEAPVNAADLPSEFEIWH